MTKPVKCPICEHKEEIEEKEGRTVHRCGGCRNLVRSIEDKKEEPKKKATKKKTTKKKTTKKKSKSKKKDEE